MQELFRFYAVRAADAAPEEQQVRLETSSSFQAALSNRGATSASINQAVQAAIDNEGAIARRELDQYRSQVQAFVHRLGQLAPSDATAPVDKWVAEDFKKSLPDLASALAANTEVLKDVLVALRTQKIIASAKPSVIVAVKVSPSSTPSPPTPLVAELMLHVRIRTAIARAAKGPQTINAMKRVPTLALTYDNVDRVVGVIKAQLAPPAPTVQQYSAQLADLAQLILAVRAACPHRLSVDPITPTDPSSIPATAASEVVPPKTVVFEPVQALITAGQFKDTISAINALPGDAIAVDLSGRYVDLHARLEAKAVVLQQLIDAATPATVTPTPAAATSPQIGGHMQLAGVADVHVVLNHVVDYKQAEISQIENILLGEKRDRKYRTLLRTQQDTENTTETTTTQEKEVKSEDRSDLKTETDTALKEALDIKAGLDVQYKQGDSLKLDLNASVGYSRTKDETNKIATEFAKDITNTAAQKVVQMVRQSVKTTQLNETEETVHHSFDNAGSTRTANVSGMYQWLEKIYENVHLTVGGPAAIFDGIVLQPAQRILAAPPASDSALGNLAPPPLLDVDPSDIHPWNYLSLAAKFNAVNVAPPPPFTTNTSFSASAADPNPQGISHDVALPDDSLAAWAVVVWDAQDRKDDDPKFADARASIGANHMYSVIEGGHAIATSTLLLAGERGMLPFAALFYDAVGYELTVDITCVRTAEAYQRWQLSIYSALASARAQAQQAYDEAVARATLQQSYDYTPSPGRVEQLIREELKRCAIGVLAKQSGGKNIFERIADLYATGQTEVVSRLALIYEHAFAWENMSYILYPYFWADSRNGGWDLHTSKSEADENWAAFLRAGAARVVVPVRDGFVRLEALGVTDPNLPPATGPAPNPLQMLQEDVSAILDETLTFDDLLSISSSKAFNAAREAALQADVISKWVEHEHWFLRTPTELVRLRPLDAKLPQWTWDPTADLSLGIAKAWKNSEDDES